MRICDQGLRAQCAVIHFSERDVVDIYQLRGAIEGLAARLAAATEPNLNVLQATVDVMREAASEGTWTVCSIAILSTISSYANCRATHTSLSTLAGYCFHSLPS